MAKNVQPEQKTNLYLLAIVAIVAVVGVVVLVLNAGSGSVSLSSADLSGEAVKAKSSEKSLIIFDVEQLSSKEKEAFSSSLTCCLHDPEGGCLCSSNDCALC